MAFESFTNTGRSFAHAQRYAIGFSAAACVLVGVLLAGQQVKADPPAEKQDEPVDVKFTEEIPEEKKIEEPPPPPEPAAAPAPLVPAMIKTNPNLPPPPENEPPPDKIPDKANEADPSKDPGAYGNNDGAPGGTGTGPAGGNGQKKEAVAPPPPPKEPPPPPPPPKAMVPDKPAEGDTPAKAISAAPPAYPDAARAAGIQGVVIVKLTIDEKGNVTSAKIIKGDPNFDEVVMKTVLGWKYEPAKRPDGTPFVSTKTVKIPFRIKG